VLTGAGVSAESGVPTFRGAGGLWRNFRAEDLATPTAFQRDPKLVWDWYNWRRGLIANCQPNAAHCVLAEMDRELDDFVLITQNVDGLHQLAGSRRIVELHGNIWRMRCTKGCRPAWEDRTDPLPTIPPRCPSCGALARPDVVWFGEPLPAEALEAAFQSVRRCPQRSTTRRSHLTLVIGTSALVQPAASLPLLAREHGAYVIEINPQPTPLSDLVDEVIRQPAAVALPAWWRAWHQRSPADLPEMPGG
jgi:NAD-dependent deacetylase